MKMFSFLPDFCLDKKDIKVTTPSSLTSMWIIVISIPGLPSEAQDFHLLSAIVGTKPQKPLNSRLDTHRLG